MKKNLTLSKQQKEIVDTIRQMIDPFGGSVECLAGGKHYKLVITIQGHKHTTPMSLSPKIGEFAVQHKINDTKRLLKQLRLL